MKYVHGSSIPPPRTHAPLGALCCCPVITAVIFQTVQDFSKGFNFAGNAFGICPTTSLFLFITVTVIVLLFHRVNPQQRCRNTGKHGAPLPVKLFLQRTSEPFY